ncbi:MULTISPECIES: hypothetical protein [unclassified Brevibacillus]|uniref:hypothetical protein n=1 Tax=unclassified Brevibacillus TaxID=2684853 RepID=UPI00356369E7
MYKSFLNKVIFTLCFVFMSLIPFVTSEAGVSSTASATNACNLPNYPTPLCTGVPVGTVLTTINGDYTVKTNNEVIDKKHITGDLIIKAANVVIKNSQIDGVVTNEIGGIFYGPFTITDSTVGPPTGCVIGVGVGDSNYTAIRVRIRGIDDGFRISQPGNVIVRDSYYKGCVPNVPDPHPDGIQSVCETTCSNILVTHNTFDQRGMSKVNSPIFIVDPLVRNVTVNNNLIGGGTYSLQLEWGGGSKWNVSGNKIIYNSWKYAPASMEGTCSNINWVSGNASVTINQNYQITSTVTNYTSCID